MNPNLAEEIKNLQEALLEYRHDLPINSMELDEECRRQPEKFDMIGEIATQAKVLVRRSKDVLDFIEADIKSQIRANPENFGLTGKVTNDAVNETLIVQQEFQEAKADYIEVQKISDNFSVLVASMEQRKAMLRDLVSLYIHKYYQNQSLSGEEKSLDSQFEQDVAEERSRDITEEG